MGLRLRGGLTYKLTEPLTGISDLRMMIRHAVGEEFSSQAEMDKIAPHLHGKWGGIVCIPLKAGTIAQIDGVEEI